MKRIRYRVYPRLPEGWHVAVGDGYPDRVIASATSENNAILIATALNMSGLVPHSLL